MNCNALVLFGAREAGSFREVAALQRWIAICFSAIGAKEAGCFREVAA